MEQHNLALDPEHLLAHARAHARAARWDDALAAIAQLVTAGAGSPELDDLANDIKLKQRLETVQLPDQPHSHQRGGGLLFAVLGAGSVLALFVVLALGVGMARLPTAATAAGLAGDLAAALPTAAPATPAATAVPAAPAPAAQNEVRAGALTASAAAGAERKLGVGNVYLILDASGSMLAPAGGARKIAIAQDALVGLVRGLPEQASLALRTYGQRRPDDCGDVELIAAPGTLDREALVAAIQAIRPVNLSRTPLAASLQAVAGDLSDVAGDTLVVLVSDGEESCGGDPVAAARELRAARPDVRISVVGFDIAPELRERLAQIAVAGGGMYVDAADVGELQGALERIVTPGFRVLDGDQQP